MKLLPSIQRINSSDVRNIVDSQIPKGLFLCHEKNWWVAVDNSTCDAWTEEFSEKRKAIRWLLRIDELF